MSGICLAAVLLAVMEDCAHRAVWLVRVYNRLITGEVRGGHRRVRPCLFEVIYPVSHTQYITMGYKFVYRK